MKIETNLERYFKFLFASLHHNVVVSIHFTTKHGAINVYGARTGSNYC